MSYIGKTTDGFGVRDRFVYVVSGGATSVSGADANGATLKFTDGAYVDVYLNGVLLKPTTDYNTNTTNTISGISSMSASDEVTVLVYDVFTVADTVSATSGGTFSGNVNFGGDIDVDGTTNLDVVDIDGAVDMASTLSVAGVSALTNKLTVLASDGTVDNEFVVDIRNDEQTDDRSFGLRLAAGSTANDRVLDIQNHAMDTVLFRINGNGHIGVNRAPTINDTIHINDTQPIIKLEETSSGGSKMTQIGVKSDGTPFLEAPQSGGQLQFFMTGTKLGRFHQYGFAVGRGVDTTSTSGPMVVYAPTATHNHNDAIVHLHKDTTVGNDRFLQARQNHTSSSVIRGRIRVNSGQNNLEFEGTSDRRIKQDIEDLTGAIDKIKELKPRTFKFKEFPNKGRFAGFIAQELNEVFPTWVTKTDDGTGDTAPTKKIISKEDNKTVESEEIDAWTLGTDALQFYLVGALKEAVAKIETLEAKVKALEEA